MYSLPTDGPQTPRVFLQVHRLGHVYQPRLLRSISVPALSGADASGKEKVRKVKLGFE